MSETETPQGPESAKPSKLDRVKRIATTTGTYMAPLAVMIVPSVLGYRASCNHLEASKVALQIATLNAQA